ncbi:hypothetical protein AOLI_G00320380 [Acnodon oligacanthus]
MEMMLEITSAALPPVHHHTAQTESLSVKWAQTPHCPPSLIPPPSSSLAWLLAAASSSLRVQSEGEDFGRYGPAQGLLCCPGEEAAAAASPHRFARRRDASGVQDASLTLAGCQRGIHPNTQTGTLCDPAPSHGLLRLLIGEQ